MIYYPIKPEFYSIFKGKEELLENLIIKHSMQINVLCESINMNDFMKRLQSFYRSDQYQIMNNMIEYTHPITKLKSYCYVNQYSFSISNLKGFDLFLERYFHIYFKLDETTFCGKWYGFNIE